MSDFAARLAAACPGWHLHQDDQGYWLTPPNGDAALITTSEALEAWLSHQERWQDAPETAELEQATLWAA